MGVADSLLQLIAAQGAEGLVIMPNKPPALRKRGENHLLSMPPMGPDMIEMIMEEVVTDDQATDLEQADAGIETSYQANGETFKVQVDRYKDSYRFTFRPKAAPRPATPQAQAQAQAQAPAPGANAADVPAATGPQFAATRAAPPAPGVSFEPGPATARALAPMAMPTALPALSSEVPAASAADVAPLMPILSRAHHERASDIFVSAQGGTWLRVGGIVRPIEETLGPDAAIRAVFEPLLAPRDRQTLAATGSADFGLAVDLGGMPARYRANLFHQRAGLAVALRPIRNDPPELRALNLPDDLTGLVQFGSGLVLMAGTAGSGKSTTLVALIEHLNRTQAKHVITLEDPIEYLYTPKRCLIHQREVGPHVDGFGSGLRAALRESPDVILVGEMRDQATIAAALTAAETGHLVLSTLHSKNGTMAVDRIIDVFPEHQQSQVRYQLATVLRAVVTQILLPTTRPPARAPAYEKMLLNTAIATKIRENRCHQIQSEIQKGRAEGMVPLELSLARLVRANMIDRETAAGVAGDPALFRDLLRGGA